MGEDPFNAIEKKSESPEVYYEEPTTGSPESVEKLITKMTALFASDGPFTEVNSLPSEIDRGPALRLLQALNDKRQTAIDSGVRAPDMKNWINNHTDRLRLDNSVPYFFGAEQVTCLSFASYISDVRIVRQLVEAGCDVRARDSLGRTPLHCSCQSDIDANSKVLFLLQCDVSLVNATDYYNNAPLHYATDKNSSDVVKTLLDHGADVDARGQLGITALHIASKQGYVVCIHELMDGGANIEAGDNKLEATPLRLAAEFNHPISVQTLIAIYKASINATNKNGDNALHRASTEGHDKVIKTLLSFDNCDVNARGQLGRTALHCACYKGHVACVHELVAGGAQIEAKESEREGTPLHLAAYFNHPDIVKTLVYDYKASINAMTKDRSTVLHCAAFSGNTYVVRLLVSNPQCDVPIRDKNGDTAADYARRRGHQNIVALLKLNIKGKL